MQDLCFIYLFPYFHSPLSLASLTDHSPYFTACRGGPAGRWQSVWLGGSSASGWDGGQGGHPAPGAAAPGEQRGGLPSRLLRPAGSAARSLPRCLPHSNALSG